jgi:cysteinyl-tRNA synthetase
VNAEKKNSTDFALWKFSPIGVKRDMEWESPWGVGFPGWHIECSAMSMKYLGECDNIMKSQTFDIHCGGIDHISVHHPNEIAQTESVTGKPMANFWLHNEWLLVGDNQKMAKSGDNFITVQTLMDKGFDPLDYRYFVLGAHYRSKLTFSWEALSGARNARLKLLSRANFYKNNSGGLSGHVIDSYYDRFVDAMSDDLNTPQALAVVWEMVKDATKNSSDIYATLIKMDLVFGLKLDSDLSFVDVPDEITQLAENRRLLRETKKWAEADIVRDEILKAGYVIDDLSDGSFQIFKS